MASIFTKIIQREIPAFILAESDNFIAFLDVFPLVEGHVLVVPKKEIDYLFDLPNDLLSEINIFAKTVAKKIQRVIPCQRIGVAVIGLEVPHAHMHLVPLQTVHDINFAKPKMKISQDRLKKIAEAIKSGSPLEPKK